MNGHEPRAHVLGITLAVLTAPLAAQAQGPGHIPRVGYAFARVSSEDQHAWNAARQGLRELGYVEGQNIALEVRWGEGRYERLPALVAELVRLKVDVLVVGTTRGALAAKSATRTPTKFDLVINLKTAKTLGLTIPLSVLARADDVIR